MLDEAALAITIKTNEPLGIDISDPNGYSIQQAKLRTEEDARMSLADKKKMKVKHMIENLRNEFLDVLNKNNVSDEHLRLTEDDF
jgi:ATP-dependent protease HslVU (ClpYQ) ATPase subunit